MLRLMPSVCQYNFSKVLNGVNSARYLSLDKYGDRPLQSSASLYGVVLRAKGVSRRATSLTNKSLVQ